MIDTGLYSCLDDDNYSYSNLGLCIYFFILEYNRVGIRVVSFSR